MKQYNKAVRDKIPEILDKNGISYETKILSDFEFLQQLNQKLVEETNEYLKSEDITELVDVIEVLCRILELKGISSERFESIRMNKAEEKGQFTKNIFLVETSDG